MKNIINVLILAIFAVGQTYCMHNNRCKTPKDSARILPLPVMPKGSKNDRCIQNIRPEGKPRDTGYRHKK